MDTRQLLEGLAAGSPEAQEAFCRKYSDEITRRARREMQGLPAWVSPTEVASSVMQRLLRHAREPEPGSDRKLTSRRDLEAYLYRVTLNRARNERKKSLARKRIPMSDIAPAELVASASFANTFENLVVRLARLTILELRPLSDAASELGIDQSRAAQLQSQVDDWIKGRRTSRRTFLSVDEMASGDEDLCLINRLATSDCSAELESIIREELGRLDDQSRQIVVMRLLQCRSYQEIADRIGVSPPTVRHRLEDILKTWETADDSIREV